MIWEESVTGMYPEPCHEKETARLCALWGCLGPDREERAWVQRSEVLGLEAHPAQQPIGAEGLGEHLLPSPPTHLQHHAIHQSLQEGRSWLAGQRR